MKLLWIVLVTIITLNADEIQRIESILKDITQLRMNYEACQEKMDANAFLLKDEHDKNVILMKELDAPNSFYAREKRYKAVIATLKQQVIAKDKLLKAKIEENKLLTKKRDTLALPRVKESVKKVDDKNIIDNNLSKEIVKPKLKPKSKPKQKTTVMRTEDVEFFKASAFRLNKTTAIYSDLNGTVLDKWEAGTSFTSGEKTKYMIKITGYFVDKKWQKAKNEMWIKVEDTTKR